MFWRFGFHNASAIDSLLDKEDVQLEAILDEDDLLQECKSQNLRLIDYFGRKDVLQKLFGYVTGSIETEEKGRFKYPYVATEVLCSDIVSIVDTCIKEQQQLLVPFWETVLDRSPEEMKTQTVMISHFTKITSIFLTKRPDDMFKFVRSQPNIIERFLTHIEAAPIQDLIIRIVQLDEQIPEAGVLQWLSSENMMTRLIRLLSPDHTPDIHTVVSDLLKSIISMATPSPAAAAAGEFGGGAAGGNGRIHGDDPGGGAQSGSASNRFARELAKRENVESLVLYILTDFHAPPPSPLEVSGTPIVAEVKQESPAETEAEPEVSPSLPNYDSQVSSVVQSICMIIELIRKNNSDLFEPCLFHTLRNRLINVQHQEQLRQQETGETPVEDQRAVLEAAMEEMVDEMGVVHLGPVLDVLIPALSTLKGYLHEPRSLRGPIQTTLGSITPLTFERYRIAELFAELLHCSNMGLLNRPPDDSSDKLYDSEGRLQGGLRGLEELAQVISMTNSGSGDTYRGDEGDESDDMILDDDEDDEEGFEREQLPISQHPRIPAEGNDSLSLDSDDSMSGDDVDDNMILEDISIHDDPPSPSSHRREAANSADGSESDPLKLQIPQTASPAQSPSLLTSSLPVPASASPQALSPSQLATSPASSVRSRGSNAPSRKNSNRSNRSRRSMNAGRSDSRVKERPIAIGERLKREYLNIDILPTLLDLFFEFPWNNFLHNAVYDAVHQILTGRVDSGLNRELAVALFRDAKLMHRIVDGSKRSDEAASKPNGVRLGYMGHLTLMSEDVLLALARFPPELRLQVSEYAPTPGWDEYVTGRYDETKRKDTKVLGGGKPNPGASKGVTRWKVDEGDEGGVATKRVGEVKGELKRGGAGSGGGIPRQTADFGPPPSMEEDHDDSSQPAPQFARYLAQEINSGPNAGSSIPGSSSDDDEDSEEELEGGWLAQSRFDLAPPPLRRRSTDEDRRPLELETSSHGFDDSFGDGIPNPAIRAFSQDPFDDFGPFSDHHQVQNHQSDPFGFSNTSNSFSDDSFDSGFGDFGDFQSSAADFGSGDFGDFQAASFSSPEREDGELTPTTGSWTFASASTSDSGVSDVSDL